MNPSILPLVATLLMNKPYAWADKTQSVSGDTMLFTGESKATASAQLLRVPCSAPEISMADGSSIFTLGKDFTWEPGSRTVTLTVDSRIPFKTSAELYPAANSPQAYKSRKGSEQWMFYGPNGVLHGLQCNASYQTEDAWSLPKVSEADAAHFGPLRKRLAESKPFKLALLGDSISTGADASALYNAGPKQPGYGELVRAGMAAKWGLQVDLVNLSKGGMDVRWGHTQVADVIKCQPDLLMIAFGMNDASGGREPEELAKVTQQIIEEVRRAVPHCAFLLISSMTANSEWAHASPKLYTPYAKALGALAGPGVALADVNAVWNAAMERKKHLDLSGNGLNHPNDAGHRLYAETILATIGMPSSTREPQR